MAGLGGNIISYVRKGLTIVYPCSRTAKVGATAGWLLSAANNQAVVTLPAGSTASTAVMPVHLTTGDTLTGFFLVGQITSAGNTATMDADLRVQVTSSGSVSDSSVASMTQVSVTANTELNSTTAAKTLASPRTVAANEIYYILLTGTTAASTSVTMSGVALQYNEN